MQVQLDKVFVCMSETTRYIGCVIWQVLSLQPVPFVFFVFLCVFPLDSDRRVVLIRFYGSEQSAQLMVLEGVILSERGKEAKQMDETKIRGESRRQRTAKKSGWDVEAGREWWMSGINRSAWKEQTIEQQILIYKEAFEIRLQKPIRIQNNPKQHLKLYKV